MVFSLTALSGKSPPEVAQHFPRTIMARRAGHATAGMRAGAAQVQPVEGSTVIGVTEQRPCRPELIQRERTVEDVAADEAEVALEVGGRQRAVCDQAGAEAGRVRLDHVENALHRFLLAQVPVDLGRKMLAEQARDMCAPGRQ